MYALLQIGLFMTGSLQALAQGGHLTVSDRTVKSKTRIEYQSCNLGAPMSYEASCDF